MIKPNSEWTPAEYIFLEDMTELDIENDISKDKLWKMYFGWCMKKRYPALSKIAFGRQVKRWIPRIQETRPLIDGRQITCWRGIRLKEKSPNTTERSERSEVYRE